MNNCNCNVVTSTYGEMKFEYHRKECILYVAVGDKLFNKKFHLENITEDNLEDTIDTVFTIVEGMQGS